MGPSGHFYSCMGLMIRDTGILQVDGGQRDTLGFGMSQLRNNLGCYNFSVF